MAFNHYGIIDATNIIGKWDITGSEKHVSQWLKSNHPSILSCMYFLKPIFKDANVLVVLFV